MNETEKKASLHIASILSSPFSASAHLVSVVWIEIYYKLYRFFSALLWTRAKGSAVLAVFVFGERFFVRFYFPFSPHPRPATPGFHVELSSRASHFRWRFKFLSQSYDTVTRMRDEEKNELEENPITHNLCMMHTLRLFCRFRIDSSSFLFHWVMPDWVMLRVSSLKTSQVPRLKVDEVCMKAAEGENVAGKSLIMLFDEDAILDFWLKRAEANGGKALHRT